jgi:hypothetical protein
MDSRIKPTSIISSKSICKLLLRSLGKESWSSKFSLANHAPSIMKTTLGLKEPLNCTTLSFQYTISSSLFTMI